MGDEERAIPWDLLAEEALAAAQKAYAPYSGYRVGAAVWDGHGTIARGCNVENASYGATLCAERVAVGAAVAAGFTGWGAMAVAALGEAWPRPCGICRQVLAEFNPDLPLLLVRADGQRVVTSLAELFPSPFRLATEEDDFAAKGDDG